MWVSLLDLGILKFKMLIKQLFILLVLLISLVICILKIDKNLKNNVATEEIKVFSIPPSRDGSIYFAYYLACKYILSHIPAVSPASSYHQKICMDIIYYCMLSMQQYMIGSPDTSYHKAPQSKIQQNHKF